LSPVEQVMIRLNKEENTISSQIIDWAARRPGATINSPDITVITSAINKFIAILSKNYFASSNSEIIRWSRSMGVQYANQGVKLSALLQILPAVRSFLLKRTGMLAIEESMSQQDMIAVTDRLNYMFDIALNETIKAFDFFKDRIISAAYEEVSELSAPIVPILNGIAVLPLIGSIDSHKANHILNNVIPKVADLKLDCLIIDFSGIHVIDTMVTDHVFKIHKILGLLGIKAILTGIRPSLAQTAVGIGIDFSSIQTFATVQQALQKTRIWYTNHLEKEG
jgi:rsbT co-antagonist protein RsbR